MGVNSESIDYSDMLVPRTQTSSTRVAWHDTFCLENTYPLGHPGHKV